MAIAYLRVSFSGIPVVMAYNLLAAIQRCSDLYRLSFMPYFRDDFDTGESFIRSLFEQNRHSASDHGLADIAFRQCRRSGGFWLTTRREVMRI